MQYSLSWLPLRKKSPNTIANYRPTVYYTEQKQSGSQLQQAIVFIVLLASFFKYLLYYKKEAKESLFTMNTRV